MNDTRVDLGQVFTPKIIANFMISLLSDINKQDKIVLDPCFGRGVFIDAFISNGYSKITGYEIDTKLFSRYKRQVSEYCQIKLHNDDFLKIDHNENYDCIVMNPPYIRHEKIDDLIGYGITKESLRKIGLFNELKNKSNLYMYFVVKALTHLKHKGELIAIFPDTWIKSKDSDFMQIIKKLAYIESINYIRGNVFGKDTLVNVSILKIVKQTENVSVLETKINHLMYKNNQLSQLETLVHNDLDSQNHCELSEVSFIRRGITTGFNSFFFENSLNDDYTDQMIASPKKISGFKTSKESVTKFFYPKRNRDFSIEVDTYIEKSKNKILSTKKPKTIYDSIMKGSKWPDFTIFDRDCKGIIFNYMVRGNMKFILNKRYLVRDNFYIISSKVIEDFLLMALLNNYYTFYRLELNGKSYGGGMLKLQKYDLAKLLIVNPNVISEEDKLLLVELVNKMIKSKKFDYLDKITLVLEKYESTKYTDILYRFNQVKNQRLGKDDNHEL